MLAFFSQWFKTIVLVMILASLIEMLLPSRSMERYVRLVLSLTVLMAVLTPVFNLLNSQWLDEGRFRQWLDQVGVADGEAASWQEQAGHLLRLQQEQAMGLAIKQLENDVAVAVESRFPVEVAQVAVRMAPTAGDAALAAMELTVRPIRLFEERSEPVTGTAEGAPSDEEGLVIDVAPVDIHIFPDRPEQASRTWTDTGDQALKRQLRAWLAQQYQLEEQHISIFWTDGR